jgi:hypothetical protein
VTLSEQVLERFRRINAVHEAGHAVASLAIGGYANYACVDNENPLAEESFGHVSRAPQNDVENNVIVFLSGMGAEIILRSVSWSLLQPSSGSGDWKNVQRYLRNHTPVERRRIIKQCKARSIEILTANWSAVLRTTDALLADGYLVGDELQALFKGEPTTPRRTGRTAKAGSAFGR